MKLSSLDQLDYTQLAGARDTASNADGLQAMKSFVELTKDDKQELEDAESVKSILRNSFVVLRRTRKTIVSERFRKEKIP